MMMPDFARELVENLGPAWAIHSASVYGALLRCAEGGLQLRFERRRLVVMASAVEPQTFTGAPAPRITVDAQRPMAVIARAILRRLVPGAKAWWEQNRLAKLEHDAAVERMGATIDRMLAVGVGLRRLPGGSIGQQTLHGSYWDGWLEVRVSPTSVNIRAQGLDPELAVAMLAGLRAWAED